MSGEEAIRWALAVGLAMLAGGGTAVLVALAVDFARGSRGRR